MPGILASLDRYPYGCAEQTTSRALPLLYVNDVAKRIGLASDAQMRERIDGAIARVLEMQDCLGRLRHLGSVRRRHVADELRHRLPDARQGGRLRGAPAGASTRRSTGCRTTSATRRTSSSGGEARAYALYVLARNGRAPIGELRYYVDTKLDDFATPLAQAQLGAALAMMGDKPRAEQALQAALKGVAGQGRRRSRGATTAPACATARR